LRQGKRKDEKIKRQTPKQNVARHSLLAITASKRPFLQHKAQISKLGLAKTALACGPLQVIVK